MNIRNSKRTPIPRGEPRGILNLAVPFVQKDLLGFNVIRIRRMHIPDKRLTVGSRHLSQLLNNLMTIIKIEHLVHITSYKIWEVYSRNQAWSFYPVIIELCI